MAEQDAPRANGADGVDDDGPGLEISIGEQYVRDLSFENPNGPEGMAALRDDANVAIEVRADAKPLGDDDFEVSLFVRAEAKAGDKTAFIMELVYAGLFRVAGLSGDDRKAAVMIECPRHLFPFARAIVANTIRDGGFPPLMIDPIDFAALYFRQTQDEDEEADQPS